MSNESNEGTARNALKRASSRVKSAFTGEDGSIFWACKELWNLGKVAVESTNMFINRKQREWTGDDSDSANEGESNESAQDKDNRSAADNSE